MRILFTGGSTGGHIYPIMSVAEQIAQISEQVATPVSLYYVGVPGPYAQELTSRAIRVSRIASAKRRQDNFLRNIVDIPFFFVSLVQAFWKIFWIMPDVLFSKGGPGALPVVLACAFYRIPIIIHESDSVAGLTNRISGRYASRIAISFATAKQSFIPEGVIDSVRAAIEQKIALIGNPIRDYFFTAPDAVSQDSAKKMLSFDPQKKLMLIIGGSQGSVRVNTFFMSIVEELLNKNIQVLHQTGVNNFSTIQPELHSMMQKYSETFRNAYHIVPYFDERTLKDAYLAADIVVSRAGGGSIFEIAAMGKPSILVPLPESAHQHQAKNAFEYATTGAAITIEESNLTKNIFFTELDTVLFNDQRLVSMRTAARAFARPDAAKVLAQEIMRLGKS
jgi:UDP-N-acetylglucosamine--N-acetylmuramyl-(pentapeptide) pyrophosphoryl-undecaprenol N-acetylglucosamine transferase